jgi:predicted permease
MFNTIIDFMNEWPLLWILLYFGIGVMVASFVCDENELNGTQENLDEGCGVIIFWPFYLTIYLFVAFFFLWLTPKMLYDYIKKKIEKWKNNK